MFEDEPLRRASGPLSAIETEDLSGLSLDDLADRVQRLHQEIERTQGVIDKKRVAQSAASAVFRS